MIVSKSLQIFGGWIGRWQCLCLWHQEAMWWLCSEIGGWKFETRAESCESRKRLQSIAGYRCDISSRTSQCLASLHSRWRIDKIRMNKTGQRESLKSPFVFPLHLSWHKKSPCAYKLQWYTCYSPLRKEHWTAWQYSMCMYLEWVIISAAISQNNNKPVYMLLFWVLPR